MNWGVITEEVAVLAAANVYDTAKLYKQENVSLGTDSAVKLGEEIIIFVESTFNNRE